MAFFSLKTAEMFRNVVDFQKRGGGFQNFRGLLLEKIYQVSPEDTTYAPGQHQGGFSPAGRSSYLCV